MKKPIRSDPAAIQPSISISRPVTAAVFVLALSADVEHAVVPGDGNLVRAEPRHLDAQHELAVLLVQVVGVP